MAAMWPLHGYPMGLGGLLAPEEVITMPHSLTDECGNIPPSSYTDHQDRVSWVVRNFSADELGLLYRTLYYLGYRYDSSDAANTRLKDRYRP